RDTINIENAITVTGIVLPHADGVVKEILHCIATGAGDIQTKFLYRPLITSLQVNLPAFHSQIFEENIVPEAVEINAVKRISVAV
ncbi:hypothetical protein, partial [Klebsiella quasipneumoniae]|uniref:hypothetical protein n=2 Tax=Klebsiella pneumoniae complex TaxID=3390273 RepID=UPI00187BDFDF